MPTNPLLINLILVAPASCSKSSICSLILTNSPLFLKFWLADNCREMLLAMLAPNNLVSMRLVCHDFSSRAAPNLFADLAITFRPSTFTKPARVQALSRIGRHVKTLTWNLPRGLDTVLPPVIDPATGAELPFLYKPHVDRLADPVAEIKRPRYGTWKMTDLLVKQYPPLFHAATDVPSFIDAMSALPTLEHLKVCCVGAGAGAGMVPPTHRSIVDYALMSLRIAVEQAPLPNFRELSLLPIHAGGLLCLHPLLGFEPKAASAKRWGQLRRLTIHMDSFPSHSNQSTEHLRILHAYLHAFSSCLTRLSFRWTGKRGPSPLSLDGEPCVQPAGSHPSRSRASLAAAAATGSGSMEKMKPLKFRRLQALELGNAAMDAGQVNAFIRRHRSMLSDFKSDDVSLRDGCWDDALIAGNNNWKRHQEEEVVVVPLMLSLDARSPSSVGAAAAVAPPPVNEPRVIGPLGGDGAGADPDGNRGSLTLGRWLSKAKAVQDAVRRPPKERRHHLFGGSGEHMDRFLRRSVFPWR